MMENDPNYKASVTESTDSKTVDVHTETTKEAVPVTDAPNEAPVAQPAKPAPDAGDA